MLRHFKLEMFVSLRSAAFVLILFSLNPAFAQSNNAESWNESKAPIVVRLPQDKLVHNMQMNKTPIHQVIAEICRRGGAHPVIDRSVDGRTMTASFSDSTLNEILSDVFARCNLHATFLTDNIILVESVDAEKFRNNQPDFDQQELPHVQPQHANTDFYPTRSSSRQPPQYLVPPPPPMP